MHTYLKIISQKQGQLISAKLLNIIHIYFIEMENRCMFTALPHQFGEKATHKHTPGQLFWEIIPVSIKLKISHGTSGGYYAKMHPKAPFFILLPEFVV